MEKTRVCQGVTYGGGDIFPVDEDTVVYICGNALCFSHVRSNQKQRFIWSEGQGISALSVCPNEKDKTCLIAYSPVSFKPSIVICDYPSRSELFRLEDPKGTELEYSTLAFSREGKYLVSCGNLPNFDVLVWDVENRSLLLSDTSMEKPAAFCAFNPADNTQFFTAGSNGLVCWKMITEFDDIRLEKKKAHLTDAEGPDLFNEDLHAPEHLTAAVWKPGNTIITTNILGEIIQLFPTSGEATILCNLEQSNTDETNQTSATSLLLTKESLVVTTSTGTVLYMTPTGEQVIHQFELIDDHGNPMIGLSTNPYPQYSKAVIGTSTGNIVDIDLMIMEKLENEDDAYDINDVKQLRRTFQSNIGYSISALPINRCIATACQDGTIQIFNTAEQKLETSFSLNAFEPRFALSTIASSQNSEKPFSVVGDSNGVLYILLICRPIGNKEENKDDTAKSELGLTVLHRERLFRSPVTSILIHKSEGVVAAASHSDHLIFVASFAVETPFSIQAFAKLPEGNDFHPVALAWHGSRRLVVVTSGGYLYSLDYSSGHGKNEPTPLSLLAKLEDQCNDIVFVPDQNVFFASSAAKKELLQYNCPSSASMLSLDSLSVTATGDATAESEIDNVKSLGPIKSYPGHLKGLISLQMTHYGGYNLLASGSNDGSVILWKLSIDGSKDISAEKVWTRRLHSKSVLDIQFAKDCTTMYTCAIDGSIFQTSLTGEDSSIQTDSDEEGASTVIKHLLSNAEKNDQVSLFTHEDCEKEPYFLKKYEDEVERKNEANRNLVLGERRGMLEDVKSQLLTLVKTNKENPEIERLEREEFCIDPVARDRIAKEGEAQQMATRTEILKENAKNFIISERIIETIYNKTDTHMESIFAFQRDGVVVHNFPIQKQSKLERAQTAMVILQRRMELQQIRSHIHNTHYDEGRKKELLRCWPGLLTFMEKAANEDGPTWLLNEGKLILPDTFDITDDEGNLFGAAQALIAKEAKTKTTKDEDDDEDDEGQGEASEIMNISIIDLLYNPLCIETDIQKRRMITLLQELIRKIKSRFNDHFMHLKSIKEQEVERVAVNNRRIEEVLNELQTDDDYFKPKYHAEEHPESVLEVRPETIESVRYLTKEEKDKLAEEEARRKALREANEKDNMEERALMEMMNGTLEEDQKIQLFGADLPREDWMDELNYEDMTDEQKAALEEWEHKQKEHEDMKEKYRKSLQLELKKGKDEVQSICRVFDEKVVEMFKLYVQTRTIIKVQELYCLRLSLELVNREKLLSVRQDVQKQVDKLMEDRAAQQTRIAVYKMKVDQFKDELEDLQKVDHRLEKEFKKEISAFSTDKVDAASLRTLLSLFRHRIGRRRSSTNVGRSSGSRRSSTMKRTSIAQSRRSSVARSSTMANSGMANSSSVGNFDMKDMMKEALQEASAQAVNNPYFDFIKEQKSKQTAKEERQKTLRPLDENTDIPEGFFVDAEVMKLLQESRLKKIRSELSIGDKKNELGMMNEHVQELEKKLNDLVGEHAEEVAILNEIDDRLRMSENNTSVVIKILQGQDECEKEPVVTDYSECALISRGRIESLNARITGLGNEKIEQLNQIKEYNKMINYMHWNHESKEFQIENLGEQLKDIHMLKVTKELQMYIRGGDNTDRQKAMLDGIERKTMLLEANDDASKKKFDRMTNQVKHKLNKILGENKKLAEHISELKQVVETRRAVLGGASSKAKSREEKSANERMKIVVARRKLIDLARAQTDEIEFLRQELDRLREKTFPSFAGAARRSGPDERYG
eukprot:g4202.t1